MSLSLKTYNVLAYEPEGVSSSLKIAGSVLDELEARINLRVSGLLLPELVKAGLAGPGTSAEEVAARAAEFPPQTLQGAAIPEDERFVLNTGPYTRLGHVPGVLGEFADLHGEMAPAGIAVTFFNTAYSSPANDYQRLAEIMGQFPAVRDSTWVVTTSLREPVPRAFADLIADRKGGRPGGGAGKRLTVTEGSPCLVPIGDSIVIRSRDESVAVIHERLKYLRRWEGKG